MFWSGVSLPTASGFSAALSVATSSGDVPNNSPAIDAAANGPAALRSIPLVALAPVPTALAAAFTPLIPRSILVGARASLGFADSDGAASGGTAPAFIRSARCSSGDKLANSLVVIPFSFKYARKMASALLPPASNDTMPPPAMPNISPRTGTLIKPPDAAI